MGVAQADLRCSEVLGCLPDPALDTLAERARPRRYAAGETVFEEGAPGDCMHLVRSGALEVFNEGLGSYGRMQQEGRIESFDVVLLDPTSLLAGYIELKGDG